MREKKLKKQRSTKEKPLATEGKTEPVTEKEKEFDFGGLPMRDLKKNLGCG